MTDPDGTRIVADVTPFETYHRSIHALSDGTGLSEEEIWMVAASAVAVTGLLAFLHAAEVVSDLRAELRRLAS
jgi:hypothetical protein